MSNDTEFPTRQPLNLRPSDSGRSLYLHWDVLELCVGSSASRVVSMFKELSSTLLDMVGSTEEGVHLLQHDVPRLWDNEQDEDGKHHVDPTKEVEGVAATG